MKNRKQGSFYLAVRLNDKDIGEDGVHFWTHIYKIFTGGRRCGEVEDLGRNTDELVAELTKKYPNKAINPLGGYANMV